MKTFLIVVAGALLLLWPAFINHYPIVFSDTGAFLAQATRPDEVFDKPWAYAPFLLALHGGTTLWLPAIGQGLLLSHVLLLTGRSLGVGSRGHLPICAVLAGASSAPWVASLLMPDIFAPITVLCLLILHDRSGRISAVERGWVLAVAMLAIAAHLSHLIIAAGCLVPLWLLRDRGRLRPGDWWPALPLLGAMLWLLGVNAVVYHRVAISPYGSVFMLARLVDDGPVLAELQTDCGRPDRPHWWLCDWRNRMPRDSDAFLWDPDGPIWSGGSGPTLHAPEASALVAATFRHQPAAVAAAMLRNTVRQLGRNAVGDALGNEWLKATVGLRLTQQFPREELTRFDADFQSENLLANRASLTIEINRVTVPLSALSCLLLILLVLLHGRHDLVRFNAVIAVGMIANAFATGALSGPHDRYGARMVWLLIPAFCLSLQSYRHFLPKHDDRT